MTKNAFIFFAIGALAFQVSALEVQIPAGGLTLAKTVTAQGYLSFNDPSMATAEVTGNYSSANEISADEAFDSYFTLAATADDANSEDGAYLLGVGAVSIYFCKGEERADFVEAGFEPATLAVAELKAIAAQGKAVKINYWDNGDPLSGKCIVDYELNE